MIHSKDLLPYTKELSILFAEDDSDFRHTTSEVLKNFFRDVVSVPNGQEALDTYRNFYQTKHKHFDLVLSDIRMPKLNGIELTSEIYNINPQQAIIILSGHDESSYLVPLINIGVTHYIHKPLDFQEFLTVLLNISKSIIPGDGSRDNSMTKIRLSDEHIFDKETDALFCGSETIYLTKYEIYFMQLLTNTPSKIYTNEEIAAYYVDKGINFDAANIRKLVSKIRKKLPEDTIESVYGVGYKITI